MKNNHNQSDNQPAQWHPLSDDRINLSAEKGNSQPEQEDRRFPRTYYGDSGQGSMLEDGKSGQESAPGRDAIVITKNFHTDYSQHRRNVQKVNIEDIREKKKKYWPVVLAMAMVFLLIGGGIFYYFKESDTAEITQVLPMGGYIAVLRSDGTVEVAGNEALDAQVAPWRNVSQIWASADYIVALKTDGTVAVAGNESLASEVAQWRNMCNIWVNGGQIAAIGTDKTVVSAGQWFGGYSPAGWTNIQDLFYDWGQTCIYGIQSNGDVVARGNFVCDPIKNCKGVKELHEGSSYIIYALLDNGAVMQGLSGRYCPGLTGSVKLVCSGHMFGLSSDGRLLTETGKLYTDSGDLYVNNENAEFYLEIDLSQYRNIKDIVLNTGLVMLKKDGTVDTLNQWGDWDLRNWNNIDRIYSKEAWEDVNSFENRIYGIRNDGSVIVASYKTVQKEMDNYRGWRLKELYAGEGGMVGLTTDGKLVGDGAYENIVHSMYD